MKYRTLGKTGLEVSVIGLGTHQFSGEWAKDFREEEVEALLGRGRQLGINFIDTAECYGDHTVESLLGRALAKCRGDWIVATKFLSAFSATPKTSARTTVRVRPALITSARATNSRPCAGRSMFTLNSTLSTSDPAGIRL